MSSAADAAAQLEDAFGLKGPELRFGLSQDELFHEAIANDRGRVHVGGPNDAQKAFPTSLGVDGPLVYYTDPECTGRPVKDTFCVDRESVTDSIWWKNGFAKFDPATFDALVPRVIDHLNSRGGHLYVTDVFCGWDTTFAEPYRFVGEYATHAYFCNIMFPKNARDDRDRGDAGWRRAGAITAVAIVARFLLVLHLLRTEIFEALLRAVAMVGLALFEELLGDLGVTIEALRLIIRPFVVIESEPLHTRENDIDRFLRGARPVGVLDAQNEFAASAARIQPVEQRGTGAADVKITGRARWKTGDDGHGARSMV